MVVVFDTETSGLSPGRQDRIIEIGAVKLGIDEIEDEFSSLIDVDVLISPSAQAVHGIRSQMLRGHQNQNRSFMPFANLSVNGPWLPTMRALTGIFSTPNMRGWGTG